MSTIAVTPYNSLLEILFPDLDAIESTDWSLFSSVMGNHWNGEGNPEDLRTLTTGERKNLISFCKQLQMPPLNYEQERQMLAATVNSWLLDRRSPEELAHPKWVHYNKMERLFNRVPSFRWDVFSSMLEYTEPTHSTQYLSRMTREEDQEEIIQICLNAFITKDWKPLQKHRMFDPVIDEERLKEQTIAQKSWEAPFLGDGPKALLEHIAKWHCAHNKRQDTIYGNYFSIVQSSGMGKSRLIDEFSRTNVVIPMNLGDSKAYGYPPPDKELAKALVALKPESFQLRIAALRTFLTVLFECALATLDAIITGTPNATYETIASLFRTQMQPTPFYEYQYPRVKLYEEIALAITEASKTPKIGTEDATPSTTNLSQSLKALVDRLKTLPRTSASNEKAMPVVYLSFDDSHTLTNEGDANNNDLSDNLRRVLLELGTGEMCSIFLSTTGKKTKPPPPIIPYHPSTCVVPLTILPIPPYTILGFDQVVNCDRPNQSWTINHVSNISFMARLGRPLFGTRLTHTSISQVSSFAAHKLLGEKKGDKLDLNQRLACLSRRLPIDFYPTSSNLQVQKKQVDGHLRVCVRVGDHFENMVTTSPSEPLLSEVAARLLYPLSSHDVLSKVMYGFDVNRGDRGEFIALQLLMDARDAVLYKWRGVIKGVIRQGNESYDFDLDDSLPIDWDLIEDDIPLTFSVTDFLKELLSKNDIDNINPYSRKKNSLYNARHTLKDIFATARMNFNHAVKVQSFSAITPSTLPSFISRSSAALCANNQYAIDAVTFFTFESLGLLRTPGIGVILYQFKTSAQCTRELCEDHLFDTMDPFELGILEEGDETPIIRIIFSFGAEAEIVPRTWKHGKLRPKFTTFDIWVGGISSKIFRPVKREEESAWKSILEASSPNIQIYNATTPGADAQKISRSQCPLVSGEKEFHSFFDYETKSIKKSTENNALPGPSRIKGKHRQGGSDELANRTFETYFEGPLTPLSLSSDDEDVDLRTMKHESGQPASHKRKQEDHAPENELPSGQSVGLGITGFTTGFPTKRLRK